jgi:hypothetical protein
MCAGRPRVRRALANGVAEAGAERASRAPRGLALSCSSATQTRQTRRARPTAREAWRFHARQQHKRARPAAPGPPHEKPGAFMPSSNTNAPHLPRPTHRTRSLAPSCSSATQTRQTRRARPTAREAWRFHALQQHKRATPPAPDPPHEKPGAFVLVSNTNAPRPLVSPSSMRRMSSSSVRPSRARSTAREAWRELTRMQHVLAMAVQTCAGPAQPVQRPVPPRSHGQTRTRTSARRSTRPEPQSTPLDDAVSSCRNAAAGPTPEAPTAARPPAPGSRRRSAIGRRSRPRRRRGRALRRRARRRAHVPDAARGPGA